MMKLIGIEEHFVTADIRAAWAASAIGEEGTGGFDRGEIGERLDNLAEQRLALMDESGVDVQVLSVTTPALHNLEPEESVTLARRTNDLVAETVAKYPTRFQGFATLPTASPEEAATELERSVTRLGLMGSMLCGRTREKNLDHPDFFPMFETAAKTSRSTLYPSADSATRRKRCLLLRLQQPDRYRLCGIRPGVALRSWYPIRPSDPGWRV
jgi:uncharacterized protein